MIESHNPTETLKWPGAEYLEDDVILHFHVKEMASCLLPFESLAGCSLLNLMITMNKISRWAQPVPSINTQ